ncbi:hypothetical protein GF362_02145 [Candidatus Dojkabacteria bacterium]|nr:hypothetical protein [Candidatus Dojkabacteria bacterium]
MKFYLSSYKLGNEYKKLQKMISKTNQKLAYISNALDFSNDINRRKKSVESDINDLQRFNVSIQKVDLREYFGKRQKLQEIIREYDLLWVRGGNTFVLRQAMKLSGFDEILLAMWKNQEKKIYGGYSAGVCVLTQTLRGIELVDDVSQKPYGTDVEVIWNGLGILDYQVAPHYKSDHPETEDVDRLVNYYIENKILFKALRDGDVITIE